jgi:hypothetical protein
MIRSLFFKSSMPLLLRLFTTLVAVVVSGAALSAMETVEPFPTMSALANVSGDQIGRATDSETAGAVDRGRGKRATADGCVPIVNEARSDG